MSLGHGASIVRSGLVLHLDAANRKSYPGTETVWTDLSGLGNHGTLVNGTVYDTLNNGCLAYDGTNDYCNFPTWNEITKGVKSGYITMEAWIKVPSSPVNSSRGYCGFNSTDAYFKFMNTSELFLDTGTTVPSRLTTKITLETSIRNKWNHVCGVYDGKAKTYYNGILSTTSTSFNLNDISSLNFTIGSGMGYYAFEGNISLVSLYNRALSATEIQQNFNATRSRYGI